MKKLVLSLVLLASSLIQAVQVRVDGYYGADPIAQVIEYDEHAPIDFDIVCGDEIIIHVKEHVTQNGVKHQPMLCKKVGDSIEVVFPGFFLNNMWNKETSLNWQKGCSLNGYTLIEDLKITFFVTQ